MDSFYTNLGSAIAANGVIRAAQLNDLQTGISRELDRRGTAKQTGTAAVNSAITSDVFKKLTANLTAGGYTGGTTDGGIVSSAQLKKYAAHIKNLYSQNLAT